MNVELQIGILVNEIKNSAKKLRWLRKHRAELEALPDANFCGSGLDFDWLSHAEVIKVIRALGGRWNKSLNQHAAPPNGAREKGQSIDYNGTLDGMPVRCYAGEPPPSCRIVEVEEVIPAHTLPAVPERHIPEVRKKVRKMICTGKDEPLLVEMSRAIAPLNNKPNGEH